MLHHRSFSASKVTLGCCATLLAYGLAVSPARAQQGQISAPAASPSSSNSNSNNTLRHFGLMVTAGVPDGATASAVFRPYAWLRSEVGGSYNLISKGIRAGITAIPFGMGPSATLEGGHYFDGNANGIARNLAGGGFQDNAALQRIGYDFANAHLGLDFGFRRVTFFVHAGMSYVRANVHDLNAELGGGMSSAGGGSSATTVSINQDPIVRVLTPSAKLGLVLYIW